jgi:hypothetical protein
MHCKHRKRIYFIWAFLLMALGACTIYKTLDSTSSASPGTGVPYFLPKGLVELSVQDQPPSQDQSAAGKVSPTPSNVLIRSTGAKLQIVPDRSAGPFYLHYVPNVGTDDTVDVTVINGLLQTANATTVDETEQIISNIVGTAANIAQMLTLRSINAPTPPTPPNIPPLNIDVTFDPQDANDVRRVKSLLASYHIAMDISSAPLRYDLESTLSGRSSNNSNPEQSGILFRQLRAYEISLHETPDQNDFFQRQLRVFLIAQEQQVQYDQANVRSQQYLIDAEEATLGGAPPENPNPNSTPSRTYYSDLADLAKYKANLAFDHALLDTYRAYQSKRWLCAANLQFTPRLHSGCSGCNATLPVSSLPRRVR